MARWGDEKTLHFIYLYRQRECLWNPRSPLYKNKVARECAYKSILQSFNDRHLDIKSVKTKIKNLRSVYHTELKKVKAFSRCSTDGSVYKPSLSWFDQMHAFLGDSVEERLEPATSAGAGVSTEFEAQGTCIDNCGASTGDGGPTDQDSPIELITIEASLEPNPDSLHDTQPTEQTQTDSKSCTITAAPTSSDQQYVKPNKRKVFRRARPHAHNTVLSALQRLENRVSNVVSTNRRDHLPHLHIVDEFHMFALSVAAQLRQLPLHIAMATQAKLQSTLSDARLASIFSNTLGSTTQTIKTED